MKLIKIKNIFLLLTNITILIMISQSCRCLICNNNNKDNPQYNLGQQINSPYDDFAPLLIKDNKLLYTSSKEAFSGYIPDKDFYGEDLFLSSKGNEIWQKSKLLDYPANSYLNEGASAPIVLNNNTFTIIAKTHDPSGFGGSDLYLAKWNGKTFTNFENLGPKFNTENWESHPSLSEDGKILVFASDKPGGFGGSDLYISYRDGISWSSPVNLGSSINTINNELSPFIINKDNTILFYSSENDDNNLDIYYNYKKNSEEWYSKQALSDGINSNYDDAFPCITSNINEIFFSSNRPGGCGGFDLYSAPLELNEPYLSIPGKVLDKINKEPLLVESQVRINDFTTSQEVYSTITNLPKSNYKINKLRTGRYVFNIIADGYFTLDTVVSISPQTNNIVNYLIPKPQLKPKKIFDLKEYNIPFFVTGYYKLNTKDNLNILRKRIKNDLAKAPYIENPGKKYDKYADKIESIFKDSIYSFVSDSLIPQFDANREEYIEIEVFGYTDPRKLNSVYIEKNINYNNIHVITGSPINNQVLSDLRAYYTMKFLDEMLSNNKNFLDLKKNNLIKYKLKGMGVDKIKKMNKTESDYDARRRVQIKIWQKPITK